jgi:hypothetical protein
MKRVINLTSTIIHLLDPKVLEICHPNYYGIGAYGELFNTCIDREDYLLGVIPPSGEVVEFEHKPHSDDFAITRTLSTEPRSILVTGQAPQSDIRHETVDNNNIIHTHIWEYQKKVPILPPPLEDTIYITYRDVGFDIHLNTTRRDFYSPGVEVYSKRYTGDVDTEGYDIIKPFLVGFIGLIQCTHWHNWHWSVSEDLWPNGLVLV